MSTCKVIRSGDAYQGQQGLTYLAGLTGATAGSHAICMTLAVLPPGARAKTHLHHGIETAVYVIEGEAAMYFGARLEELVVGHAGEYMYVPADMPHLVMNRSSAVCRAVVAHTAADDQAGIVMLPELDLVHPPA
ncbi:MAG TPA: cupin domain-containing protein [Vicinamibacterales bacterium]|nr:cupin domain-containing protein [Vicinamibacterales bacterium]